MIYNKRIIVKHLLAVRDVGVFKFKTKKSMESVIKDLDERGVEWGLAEVDKVKTRKSKKKKKTTSVQIDVDHLKRIEKRYGKLQKFLDETLKEEMTK